MQPSLRQIVEDYNPHLPLPEAFSPFSAWYVDSRLFELEQSTVFARSWQMVGRVDQVREPGQYMTWKLAGEPILIVRGNDGMLRGFFNVCRHKGTAIMSSPSGRTQILRCHYHGWTYTLEGGMKGTPDFSGVKDFDPAAHGLVPLATAIWEDWIFVKLESHGPALEEFLGAHPRKQVHDLPLQNLHWMEQRRYTIHCNWKVFVDNYLDGGYHVPYLHAGLNSVLDYSRYTIECGDRFCAQSCPIATGTGDRDTASVRKGDHALYVWIYPNFMINYYQGVMDTNTVCPLSVDRTEVIFDFYFADVSEKAQRHNLASIAVSERIQGEDVTVCESVQRGLASRACKPGRLSVRREAGEHLFHRLLYNDLKAGLD
jgi:phenylpropionate dioxygenase-like ring-hydroxylating dioxygenase large terminal subunit